MKKILLAILAIAASVKMYAQTPVQITFWNQDKKVTVEEAGQTGVQINTDNTTRTLTLKCSFNPKDIQACGGSKNYEVKWYYYMSTRKSLMGTNLVTVNASDVNSDGCCYLSCMKNNFRSGWWEVQIKDRSTNSVLMWGGLNAFPIKIN